MESGARRTKIFNIAVIISFVLFVSLILVSLIHTGPNDVYTSFMDILLLSVYGTLSIVYGITLFIMIRAMYRLVISELRTERDSVVIQFGLMLFSFVTRFVYFLI